MAAVGRLLLIFALVTTLYGLGASLHGARGGGRAWVESGRRAMYALWGMAAIAFVILDVAFISSNFSYNVVASGSSTTTPFFYRVAAIWSTQQGSLLLWLLLLSGWSSLALFLTRRRVREIAPYAQAVLFALTAFFSGLLVFFANPFATSSHAAGRGRRPGPAAAPHDDDGPSADAVLGLHADDGAVRVRGRRPDQRTAERRMDPGHPPLRARRLAMPRRRHPARRALVLHRAGLGWLLGLGSGRERRPDAVAVRHRLHPLDHDPGEAGDAEGLERLPGPGRRHAWP